MKVKELKNQGLEREYEISVPAGTIVSQVEKELEEKKENFEMAGFRKGNVPINIVRKKLGSEILAKIIEKEVDDTLKKVFEDKKIKPALQPFVEIKSFDEKADLTFTAKIEVFPETPVPDWTKIEIETLKIQVSDEDLSKAHEDIVKNFKNFDEAAATYAAKKGDAVIIDFIGTVDGKEFDGGKGEGIRLELGSNQFIPGFEDQLVGAKKEAAVKVRVKFPKNYGNKDLAGKPALFDVKVTQVLKPQDVGAIDDEFAKKLGVDTVDKLNEMIKQKIEADFNGLARLRMKKLLFDKIDSEHKFDIPPGMLKIDFEAMWNEIKAQKEANPEFFKGKSEADLKKEYEEIAKRRVRLGIILAETAKENNIEVAESDLQQAVYAEAMQRPGQEKIIMDFYSKPENLEKLKGPLLEEKAVDFILTKVKAKEKEITSKEFFDKYADDINPDMAANA